VLYSLPILALFAKITPAKIEGTIFAFLTGTMNLASTVIQPGMGTLINSKFVGANKKRYERLPNSLPHSVHLQYSHFHTPAVDTDKNIIKRVQRN